MLARPTNPDVALNLPHLEEKKIQHEVVIMEVEQNKGITLGLFQKLTCGGGGGGRQKKILVGGGTFHN